MSSQRLNHICNTCGVIFSSADQLAEHGRVAHKKQDVEVTEQ